MKRNKNHTMRSTFSREERFSEYRTYERRSNVLLGPGRYNDLSVSLKRCRQPCLVTYVTPFCILPE